jgi:hypothetical protein
MIKHGLVEAHFKYMSVPVSRLEKPVSKELCRVFNVPRGATYREWLEATRVRTIRNVRKLRLDARPRTSERAVKARKAAKSKV